MPQGPEDKPPKKHADPSKAGFDDVWGELIGEGTDAPEPVAPAPSSPISTEDDAQDASDEASTDATKPWTDAARARPLQRAQSAEQADDVRPDALMAAAGKKAAEKAVVRDATPGAAAKGASEISGSTSSPRLQHPEEEMDRLMSGQAAIPEPAIAKEHSDADEDAPADAEAVKKEEAAEEKKEAAEDDKGDAAEEKKEAAEDDKGDAAEEKKEAAADDKGEAAQDDKEAAAEDDKEEAAQADKEAAAADDKEAAAADDKEAAAADDKEAAAADKKEAAEDEKEAVEDKKEAAADKKEAVEDKKEAAEDEKDAAAEDDERAAEDKEKAAVADRAEAVEADEKHAASPDAAADKKVAASDRRRAAASDGDRSKVEPSVGAAEESGGGGGWMWIAAAAVLGAVGLWSVMRDDDKGATDRDTARPADARPDDRVSVRDAKQDQTPPTAPDRPSLAGDPGQLTAVGPQDPMGEEHADDGAADETAGGAAADDGGEPPTNDAEADAASAGDPDNADDGPATPADDDEGDEPGDDSEETEDRDTRPSSGGDLRKPPAGTPPKNAEAFARLPVAPDDRRPVGGVGESGVHVDRISLGPVYKKGECSGGSDTVSVAEHKRFNVCLRVVHPRQEERVIVVWERDGQTARRSKLDIPASHAYRTRAYLLLRGDYVGRWTARVMSEDGSELASHAFTVVE